MDGYLAGVTVNGVKLNNNHMDQMILAIQLKDYWGYNVKGPNQMAT